MLLGALGVIEEMKSPCGGRGFWSLLVIGIDWLINARRNALDWLIPVTRGVWSYLVVVVPIDIVHPHIPIGWRC